MRAKPLYPRLLERSLIEALEDSPVVTAADFSGLRKLKAAAGKRFCAGVVIYDGEARVSFGPDLHAVPLQALWA
jgi:hypothetical protein